jgi:hypothetical protein
MNQLICDLFHWEEILPTYSDKYLKQKLNDFRESEDWDMVDVCLDVMRKRKEVRKELGWSEVVINGIKYEVIWKDEKGFWIVDNKTNQDLSTYIIHTFKGIEKQ